MGFSGNLKQELQEPRLREAGDGEYLPGADVQPLSSQTEPTAAVAQLGWTCSRSQCWCVAGPSVCTPANTHLGPSVILSRSIGLCGGQRRAGDLWKFHCEEGIALVSLDRQIRPTSFWGKVEMPERTAKSLPPCILVSRQAPDAPMSSLPSRCEECNYQANLPWLWQGSPASLPPSGRPFPGSLWCGMDHLDILQGSTGDTRCLQEVFSACSFQRVKGSPCLEHGWACDRWGNLLKCRVTSGGGTLTGRQDGPPRLLGWALCSCPDCGRLPLPVLSADHQLTALPSRRTCLGPVGLQALTFPPWGQKWIQATLARAFYCQGAIHLVLFLR